MDVDDGEGVFLCRLGCKLVKFNEGFRLLWVCLVIFILVNRFKFGGILNVCVGFVCVFVWNCVIDGLCDKV